MTTPVVSHPEKVAMTTPVVSSKDARDSSRCVMKFVLPSKYQSVEEAPVPTNSHVQLAVIPPSDMAVIQFNGWCDNSSAVSKYEELVSRMRDSGFEKAGPWELRRYNPPYALPPFRRNEVCIPVRAKA